jgi:hypothetical protein
MSLAGAALGNYSGDDKPSPRIERSGDCADYLGSAKVSDREIAQSGQSVAIGTR